MESHVPSKLDLSSNPLLIEPHVGLVKSIAWRLKASLPEWVEMDDLVGHGYVGLLEAAAAFDPQRGVAFSTFAYTRIQGAILDAVSRSPWFDWSRYHNNEWSEDPAPGPWSSRTAGSIQRSDDLMRSVSGSHRESASPDQACIEREQRRQLYAAFSRLAPDKARLLWVVLFQGGTLASAAADMGFSSSWASRLFRTALDDLYCSMARNR